MTTQCKFPYSIHFVSAPFSNIRPLLVRHLPNSLYQVVQPLSLVARAILPGQHSLPVALVLHPLPLILEHFVRLLSLPVPLVVEPFPHVTEFTLHEFAHPLSHVLIPLSDVIMPWPPIELSLSTPHIFLPFPFVVFPIRHRKRSEAPS